MNRVLTVLVAGAALLAQIPGVHAAELMPWNLQQLSRPPATFNASAHSTNGVEAIFYEGLPWRGKPTRVFAYYAIPKTTNGAKVPAMVLVHGGGGSAFVPWVKLWVDRGYAAIAMDTCGCISGGGYQNHPRHPAGGPPGWGGLDQLEEPIEDQWTYHAVADVILAHSLIRSFSEVDSNRIGITGISWGGYLTCIAAGVDSRFKLAVPVYGCGFLGENSVWLDDIKKMGPENSAKWLKLWDPSTYLPGAHMPFLWVSGTCDFAYPMDSWQKSYRQPKGSRTICLRINMPHGHGGPGENPEEIHAMADALLRDGIPMPQVTNMRQSGTQFHVTYQSKRPVIKAELNYTTDTGPWQKRVWQTQQATLDPELRKATASVPEQATVFYFNITDDHGLVVSSEHQERLPH